MLGFVAENIPKSSAFGLNLMGGAGMFAVSIYMIFMGGFYDRKLLEKLPSGQHYRTTALPPADRKWRRHYPRPKAAINIIQDYFLFQEPIFQLPNLHNTAYLCIKLYSNFQKI
jgi:hypothetical protein